MSHPPEDRALLSERRRRVLAALGEDAAMLLPAAPELRAGLDTELRYRVDAELYYLTGYGEPQAVALLDPSDDEGPYTLFVRPRDPDAERWSGARGGPEAALERYGADAAYSIDELPKRLRATFERANTLYYRLGGGREDVDALVLAELARGRKGRQRRGRGVSAVLDPGLLLDDMRVLKSPAELERVREACRLSVEVFREAATLIRPGAGEWELEAALDGGFRRRGAAGPAFPSIVASGANATVLHYITNDRRMQAGDLVLVDAGAQVRLYAGDISRTFPVSGRFTPEQRRVYELVLAAHDAAIAAVRPGATEADVHGVAVRTLVEGLVDLGALEGDPTEIAQDKERYKAFYPHRTSHWLGLDVHDVGDYMRAGEPRVLEAGMVLTIEPGLYFPPETEDAPAGLRGLGVRIEDDVAVTDTGAEVLTAGLPTDADSVEGLTGT